MDLSLLQALERQKILQVLQRDRMLRTIEEDRIRRLKQDVQEIRRRGAKSFSRQYSERTCARCQRPLGKLWNSGAVCHGCSHRICGRDLRVRSGDWFLEERAKKFPVNTDGHDTRETMADTLSHSTFFTKSVEDLMVSFTSHIKKISKSQNDVRGNDVRRLTVGPANCYTGQKSLSDTDIDRALHSPEQNYQFCTGDCEQNKTREERDILIQRTCHSGLLGAAARREYVKIYLETDKAQASKRKTAVKRNTTNPVYNEDLQYQIERPLLSGSTLRASVWHSGSLKRKLFLGETLIPLGAWCCEETATAAWYPLGSKRPVSPEGGAVEQGKAELRVRLKLGPTCATSNICQTHGVDIESHGNHRLTVLISGAKNLPIRANTSQNIYVKGCLTLSRGKRAVVSSSPTQRDAAGPDPQELLFDGLSRAELADCVLVLEVWDHVHLTLTDRALCGARLDANKLGLLTVLQKPNQWHDFSLPLIANVDSRRT
ncbi:hypothetical protein NHX12_025732 [Muraenolepis orangiensis]|uniref:Synaptotagmin-like protein 3 n=1 Tax=Muraenolepis orangiensis TaxID=630683 RepID=A0A9Q0EKN7_9TELE|nr:hypothetical protein NHX12_025732 [Muraenolepis orangiensis]